MRTLILCFIMTISCNLMAKPSHSGCPNVTLSKNLLNKYDTKSILAGTIENPIPFSKVAIAVSLEDSSYFNEESSPEEIFEALFVTMSNDMKMFNMLFNLVTENEINKPSKLGGTYLMYATMCNRNNAVRMFLQKGADPNLAFSGGQFPIVLAALEGNEKILDYLINNGAKCNIDMIRTPLINIANNTDNINITSILNQCLES